MDYHKRTRHETLRELWTVVKNNGSSGNLDAKIDEFLQIAINELNSIKQSLQATLVGTALQEMTFDSNLKVNTCMHMSYRYEQLPILGDYLEHSGKTTKCKALAQKFAKRNLNLAYVYELPFSSIHMIFVLPMENNLCRILYTSFAQIICVFCKKEKQKKLI